MTTSKHTFSVFQIVKNITILSHIVRYMYSETWRIFFLVIRKDYLQEDIFVSLYTVRSKIKEGCVLFWGLSHYQMALFCPSFHVVFHGF